MVYRKRQTEQVATGGLNLSGAKQMIDQGIKQASGLVVDKAKEAEQTKKNIEKADKEIQQTKNTMMTEGLNAGSKNMQTAYASFGDDPKGYMKASAKSREELKKAYEDPKEQAYFLARYDLDNQVYQAKVDNNYQKKKDARTKAAYSRQVDEELGNIQNTAGLLITAHGKNATEADKQSAQMIATRSNSLYENRDAQDSKGNYIYSLAQRKQIVDNHNNLGAYAVTNLVNSVDPDDKATVNELYTQMTEDKEGFLKQMPMDEDTYQSTLKSLKSISGGAVSPQFAAEQIGFQQNVKNMYNQFEIGKEGIKNGKLKNISSVVGYMDTIKQGMNSGHISIKDGTKKLGQMRPQLDSLIKEGETASGDWIHASSGTYLHQSITASPYYKTLPKDAQNDLIENAFSKVMQESGDKFSNVANAEQKKMIDKIVQEEVIQTTKNVLPFSRTLQSRPNLVMGEDNQGGMSMQPFGGDDTNGLALNSGGNIEVIDGKTYIVNKDSLGNILSKRKVSSNG